MKTNHFSQKLLIVCAFCALLFLSFGADAQTTNGGSAKDTQKKDADTDLTGTYWACTTTLKGLEKINFRLLRGGGIRYQNMVVEDSKEELIENGSWEITGNEVRLYIKYSTQAIWNGTLANDRIDGSASNEAGGKWKFSCRKSS